MKNLIRLPFADFIALLMSVEIGTFAHVKMRTPVRMNKTGNPYFGRATKYTRTNILLGGRDYEEAVLKEMNKAGIFGTFVAEKNRVGEHVSRVVLFNENLNRHYMQVEYFEKVKPCEVTYFLDGNEVDGNIFADYLVKKSTASRQPQNKKVHTFSVDVTNVESLTFNGTEYQPY